MKKYNAKAKKDGVEIGIEIYAQNLKEARAYLDENGYTEVSVLVSANCSHFCGYCGALVYNDFEDLLCDNCREVLGHALYSEL